MLTCAAVSAIIAAGIAFVAERRSQPAEAGNTKNGAESSPSKRPNGQNGKAPSAVAAKPPAPPPPPPPPPSGALNAPAPSLPAPAPVGPVPTRSQTAAIPAISPPIAPPPPISSPPPIADQQTPSEPVPTLFPGTAPTPPIRPRQPGEPASGAPGTADLAAAAPSSVNPRAQAEGQIVPGPNVPLDCIPQPLQDVLSDVAARFGPITIVSTSRLNTRNHSAGSAREKLHLACKAVDFRSPAAAKAVTEYLRTRPEVAGINSYRDGVIHFDLNENAAASSRMRQTAR